MDLGVCNRYLLFLQISIVKIIFLLKYDILFYKSPHLQLTPVIISDAHEVPGPVKWTRPYFDCGRSNKWLVAAVVPIADLYPRHTGFRHIEYPM